MLLEGTEVVPPVLQRMPQAIGKHGLGEAVVAPGLEVQAAGRGAALGLAV